MLSRTADHLNWMARYMERAENLARMLDVNNRMSLMPQSEREVERLWTATLDSIELLDAYHERHEEITPRDVAMFMTLDRDNPGSIYSCLRAARENAHAVRGTLTSELWETVNATWLKIRDYTPAQMEADGVDVFFEWVKRRSHESRGVTIGTMMRDEATTFLRLGTLLERADNTARILGVKYRFITEAPRRDEAAEYYQWSALLNSVAAFEIYRRVYRDQITPVRIAELLILDQNLPRSLACCMSDINMWLSSVLNKNTIETERYAGKMAAKLRYGRIEDIFESGLNVFLEDFLGKINGLGNRIATDFLLPISTPEPEQSQTQA